MLSVMLSAITPLRFEPAILQAITGDAGTRTTNVAEHILDHAYQRLTIDIQAHLPITFLAKAPALEIRKLTLFQFQKIKSKPATAACNDEKS